VLIDLLNPELRKVVAALRVLITVTHLGKSSFGQGQQEVGQERRDAQVDIRGPANVWKKPMISVPPDGAET
jgi:hypothetical protein